MGQSLKPGQNWINPRMLFTDDRVLLEEDVVVFTAADLEDELTDIEQVVPTDTKLGRKMPKKQTTEKTSNFCFEVLKCPAWPCNSDLAAHALTPARPHRHRRLTARQSLAMRRLSCAELRSMRWNSVRSIPDLLLQRRPSMSAFAKVLWRPSHKSHRRSTEPSELPGIAGKWLLWKKKKKLCQVQGNMSNIHSEDKQPKMKTFSCVCVLASVHPYKYRGMFCACYGMFVLFKWALLQTLTLRGSSLFL